MTESKKVLFTYNLARVKDAAKRVGFKWHCRCVSGADAPVPNAECWIHNGRRVCWDCGNWSYIDDSIRHSDFCKFDESRHIALTWKELFEQKLLDPAWSSCRVYPCQYKHCHPAITLPRDRHNKQYQDHERI